jgi:hypothetical protein
MIMGVLLGACGGAKGQVTPSPDAETSLRAFLQAAADSNVAVMAEHWGTNRGSAARTNNPSDYQKRIVIMQAYLRGAQYRLLANEAVPGENNQRLLTVEFSRAGCVSQVPFTMIRTGRGEWLINQFNLELLGSPARACVAQDTARH